MSADTPKQVWAARLGAGLDDRARALNDSLPIDQRLWPEEIALSRAYAASLAECGVMSGDELHALGIACDRIEADLMSGALVLQGEDVHSAIETALIAHCGDAGKKLHTGRSRNDQVSTLMRLR